MRTSRALGTALVVLAGLGLWAASALADTLTLKDGTKLEGTLVEQNADEIVFEHALGGSKVKTTFKKSEVASLEQSFGKDAGKDPKAGGSTKTDKPDADKPDYAELKDYAHCVILVVDRSGSMAIEDRFGAALAEVDKILKELPANTGFGVYLFDTKAVSVFDSNFVKTHDPARQRLRKRIEELGGLDRTGFTDLVASLPTAIHARPDAIYLLSDGVPTKGTLERSAVVKAIKDLMPAKKFPIHTVAVRGGTYAEGLEENDEVARSILKQISEATGGKYREVTAKGRESGSALKKDPLAKNQDVEFHCYARNREFTERELRFPNFEVRIEDELFSSGRAVVEYASVEFDVKTKTDAGVAFDEVVNIPVVWKETDAEKKGGMGLGSTLSAGPKALWTPRIRVVRPQDSREGEAEGTIFAKIPSEGGTVELFYRRGKKSWNKVFIVKPALIDWTTVK